MSFIKLKTVIFFSLLIFFLPPPLTQVNASNFNYNLKYQYYSAPPLNISKDYSFTQNLNFSNIPEAGSLKLAVIAVEFSDYNHTRSIDELKDDFNKMNNYFRESSFGKVWAETEVFGWVKLNHTMIYYGRDGLKPDDGNNDGFPDTWNLIQDAIKAVDKQVNFSGYRYLMVVHAGNGQESSKNPRDIWSITYIMGITFKTNDNWSYSSAAIVPETEAQGAVPLGVYAHEFSHLLGLPDLYIYSSQSRPVGNWDLMDRGCWNGNPPGSSPAHYTAWGKIKFKWIEESKVLTIGLGSRVNATLNPIEVPSEGYQALKISISSYRYYLIEVRAKIGFDAALPNEGVLISLINDNAGSGGGIVKIQDSHPETSTLDDAAFQVGETFIDSKNEFSIKILSKHENSSYTIMVGSSTPAPDIAIQELTINPYPPKINETTTIKVIVVNKGFKTANNFYVNFYIDNSLYEKVKISSLARGESKEISTQWKPESGKHNIEAKIELSSSGIDMDWSNNYASKEVDVGFIIVIKVPENLTVKVNGTSYTPDAIGEVKLTALNATLTIEVEKAVSLSNEEKVVFAGWSDGDSANPKILKVSKDCFLSANYRRQFKVSIDAGGGSVSGGGWYNEGDLALIKAETPFTSQDRKTRLIFIGWSGDVNSNSTELSLTVTHPYKISAKWLRQYYLEVKSTLGFISGGGWYNEGDLAYIFVSQPLIIENGTRKTFIGWKGDLNSNALNASILMDSPKTIEASWRIEHYLKIESLYGEPEGEDWYTHNSIANYSIQKYLEFTNGTKRVFEGWIGDLNSTEASGSILMDSPKTIEAKWKTQFKLILSASGLPNGTSITISLNNQEFNATIPFIYNYWFDSNSEISLNATKTISSSLTRYVFDCWRDEKGNKVDSVFNLDSPKNITVVYREAFGCLIATATYGSELSPEVSFLRSFRDKEVMATFAGKNFMKVFNAWYYSFSPKIAEAIDLNIKLKEAFKIILYPLLLILHLTKIFYSFLSFNPELAVIASGVLASALIGLTYLTPLALPLSIFIVKRDLTKALKRLSLSLWFLSFILIVSAEALQNSLVMKASSSLLVLATLTFSPLLLYIYTINFAKNLIYSKAN
ncbi:M6 family metalloprotease domain-containing protein [Candidatus Bathyarchaeota archaeon]|nr:M6 family metalloprotease domain-containing protein [Candidatus Bathyarchaeota archaeon]